jgi:Mlc titration factor MtfA (ptsG expression regulator)
MKRPFPAAREAILRSRVAYYQALTESEKERFRKLVQIFLDEIRITGVRTEVDESTRILVAASAIIPIFGFHDWEYHRLSEVLVYPNSFNQEYQTEGEGKEDRNILGLAGFGHLSGVMILSKPALESGFGGVSDKENVGIHEFAHLVEQEEVSHGIPAEVPREIVLEWVGYVAHALAHPKANQAHINPYGYTNDREFFAVMTEYFFKSPEVLQEHDPTVYNMLRKMFHQDPASLMGHLRPRQHISRNSECPCGSGKKFKDCCQPHLIRSND